jgi:predicted O-methyltransferase YrrM
MYWKALKSTPGSPEESLRLSSDPSLIHAPVSLVFMASLSALLSEDLGMRRSAETGESRLGDGTPVPMMSFGLIEYLDSLDLRAAEVLEIGGGLSTEFWTARARSVCTLETNPDWARAIAARNPTAQVEFVDRPLAARIEAFERQFDLIIIDPAGNRLSCAKSALAKLRPGGFIILDNSEWYPNASKVLRSAGLIEIDFHDFRPCHHFRTTTSMYLHPEFRPIPKGDRLPRVPIGGKDLALNHWDREA